MLSLNIRRWMLYSQEKEHLSPQAIGGMSLLTCILAASTYNAFAKELSGSLSPLSLLVFSEVLTSFFVLFSFGAVPTVKAMMKLDRGEFLANVAIGITSGIVGPMLWFIGLEHTTAVNASLFGNTDILFTTTMAALFLGDRLTPAHAAGAACILFGVITIVLQGFTDGLTIGFGDGIILVAAFCFSSGTIIYRKFLHSHQPHVSVLMRGGTAILFFLLISPFLSHSFGDELRALPLALVPTLLGFGFISRFINVFAYYGAVDRLPVPTVSLFATFSVIGGAVFASVYTGAPLLWYHYLGGSFLFMGAILFEIITTVHAKRVRRELLKSIH